MNSFYYGLSLFAFLLILYWYVRNDAQGQDDGSIGLLAMKSDKPKVEAEPPSIPGKRSFRRKK